MHMHDEPVCALGVAFWDSVKLKLKIWTERDEIGFFFFFFFCRSNVWEWEQNRERFDGANKVGGMFGLAALTLVYVTACI